MVKTMKLLSRKILSSFVLLAIVVAVLYASFGLSQKTADAAWYTTGGTWSYRKPIIVDHSKVAGTTNISNFPILVSVTDSELKSVANGGKVASDSGFDILFTSLDGTTKLSHEIEKYDPTTGELVAWVNIPTLSVSVDTSLFIYFGNASASDQQDVADGVNDVWDSNFEGVWHLASTTGTTLIDSSSNAQDLTKVSASVPNPIVGKVDGAQDFSLGDSDSPSCSDANCGGTSDLDIGTRAFTISVWVKPDTSQGNGLAAFQGGFLLSKIGDTESGWFIALDDLKIACGVRISLGTEYACSTTGSQLTIGSWAYVTVVIDRPNSTMYRYLNGETYGISGSVGFPASNVNHNLNFCIGARDGGAGCRDRLYDGVLDEARVSNVVRSAGWIKTEYNNQSSPSTFYSYGALGVQTRTVPAEKVRGGVKVKGGVKFK